MQKNMFFIGLFLICMSTLMLQIIETRILSVISMYYMAFLSISMAMLGMTIGALVVYFKLGNVNSDNVASYLSKVSTAYALAIVSCFLLQLASPVPMVVSGTQLIVWLKILTLMAAPFTVAGVAVSLALTKSPFPIGQTYGVDLLGAGIGCLGVVLLLNFIDASSAMFVVASIAALAGTCFRSAHGETSFDNLFPNWNILHRPGIVAIAIILFAMANSTTRHSFQPISAKFNKISVGTNYEFEKWNSFSRITASKSRTGPPKIWGRSPTLPNDLEVEQRRMSIDGFAGTTMPRFSGDTASVDFLKYDITNLAYAARPNGRVAIIGVGSGRDLLSAYTFGSRDITGVELNPIFIELLTDPRKLRSYAGVADLTGVRLIVDEGRSWFARTKEKFDLLQMSMIDTFAATGAGALSLTENGLYTVEAWKIFLSSLRPNGLFTVSRWHASTAPIEIGRTVSLAVGALSLMGVENPRNHIYLATVGSLATLIVSRQPLTMKDINILNARAEELQFDILAVPGQISAVPMFEDLLSATSIEDINDRSNKYFLDVSPPTDARPFFFNQLRLHNLMNLKKFIEEALRSREIVGSTSLVVVGNLVAISTLFLLILLSLTAVVVTCILPARSSTYTVAPRLALLGSAYFLLIGLGFMFIEIGMIQRLSVFIGHPIHALSIVLFSIIISTGLGSLLSEKIMRARPAYVIVWLVLLVVYILALPHLLPALTHSSLESAVLAIRAMVSVAVILPAGILMGFAFPLGMKIVMSQDTRPAPWFWGVNGAAGVLAAGLAVVCSIAFSINTTILIGALCYLILLPITLLLMATPKTPNQDAVNDHA